MRGARREAKWVLWESSFLMKSIDGSIIEVFEWYEGKALLGARDKRSNLELQVIMSDTGTSETSGGNDA